MKSTRNLVGGENMLEITGLGVAEGYVKAKAFILKEPQLEVAYRRVEETQKEVERAHFAVEEAVRQIEELIQSMNQGENANSDIFEAHKMMLLDSDFHDGICNIIKEEKACAEYACRKNSETLEAIFTAMEDEYMQARGADIADVSNRVLRILAGITENPLDGIAEPCIIVARDLTPSDTAKIGEKPVYGFVTRIGGRTSHSAIMARSMEIAAIAGVGDALSQIQEGDWLLLDGCSGEIIVNPDDTAKATFEQKEKVYKEKQKLLERFRDEEGKTSDGKRVMIEGNIGTPSEAVRVQELGGEGIGLFRSEFLFMDRQDLPNEEEQFQAYKEVAETMSGKPVIIRTLDIGGDKEVPALHLEKEENPFLGYRAIRICLDQEELFMVQLRAILRASSYGNIKIMFPMISSLKELRDAKAVLEKAKGELEQEGVSFAKDIKVGIMIEIPAVAICADILAQEADFFSIGTNDLIQYSLAVDRINEKVSHLYNMLHPGVLRLIKMTAEAGKAAGIEVGVCGEMAGTRGMAPILLGLGVTHLSMSASSILEAKATLSKYTQEECRQVAERLLNDNDEE